MVLEPGYFKQLIKWQLKLDDATYDERKARREARNNSLARNELANRVYAGGVESDPQFIKSYLECVLEGRRLRNERGEAAARRRKASTMVEAMAETALRDLNKGG